MSPSSSAPSRASLLASALTASSSAASFAVINSVISVSASPRPLMALPDPTVDLVGALSHLLLALLSLVFALQKVAHLLTFSF